MGVEPAQHVTNHARALDVWSVPQVAGDLLGVKDTPVDGFQAVTHVWQGARDDDAHGVVHERRFHLVFNRYRQPVVAAAVAPTALGR